MADHESPVKENEHVEHMDNHEEEGNDEVLRRFQVLVWSVRSGWDKT